MCSTGTPLVSRSFFKPGEPQGGTNENCVCFHVNNFLLADIYCASNLMILCEKDAQ